MRFSVRDDGAGFDPRFVRGLGLLGMEERVRRLGGQIEIDSQLGRGTRDSRPTCRWRSWRRPMDKDAHSHILG